MYLSLQFLEFWTLLNPFPFSHFFPIPSPPPICCLVSLVECGIVPPLSVSLLNDKTALHMSSLGTFVPVLYHTHKQIHTQHTQGPSDWHINIYYLHLLCALSSYLDYIELATHWYQKQVGNVLVVQTLLTCRNHISVN